MTVTFVPCLSLDPKNCIPRRFYYLLKNGNLFFLTNNKRGRGEEKEREKHGFIYKLNLYFYNTKNNNC